MPYVGCWPLGFPRSRPNGRRRRRSQEGKHVLDEPSGREKRREVCAPTDVGGGVHKKGSMYFAQKEPTRRNIENPNPTDVGGGEHKKGSIFSAPKENPTRWGFEDHDPPDVGGGDHKKGSMFSMSPRAGKKDERYALQWHSPRGGQRRSHCLAADTSSRKAVL